MANRATAGDVSVASDFHFQEERLEMNRGRSIYYGKQGHICCYCCCDTRRASIIMNFTSIIFCFLCIAATYLISEDLVPIDEWFARVHDAVEGLDDDDLQTDLHLVFENYAWAVYTFQGVNIVFAIIGIEGAVNYRPSMVLTCAIWYLIQGIASLFILGWGGLGIFLASLWVYPNIMLYQEQLEGIMSEENYANEIHSCCCVENSHRRVTIQEAIENRLGVFS